MLDGRHLVGQMVAFDKHMNLVIVDCEEFRSGKKIKTGDKSSGTLNTGIQKRTLGLIIIRGENIVSISVEAGPPPSGDSKHRVPASTVLGPGIGRPMVRGIPVVAPVQGLAGPVRGIGTMPLPTGTIPSGFRPGMPTGVPPPMRPPGMPRPYQ